MIWDPSSALADDARDVASAVAHEALALLTVSEDSPHPARIAAAVVGASLAAAAVAAAVALVLLILGGISDVVVETASRSTAGTVRVRPRTTPTSNHVVLVGFGQRSQWPQASPFVCKLDAFLRVSGIKFRLEPARSAADLPTGKVPVLHFRGEVLSDSHFIVKRLVAEGLAPDFDADLTAAERARAECLRHALESVVYWGFVRERWCNDAIWPHTEAEYFASLPWAIRAIVIRFVVRPGVVRAAHAVGVSRYTQSQWESILADCFASLAAQLGTNRFIMGDRISTVDFTAFGILANCIYYEELNPVMARHACMHTNLVEYTARLHREWIRS
ncbi:hypothetical protein HK105_204016 [Polyrhizophydium stewartii]|uniref:Glutathione S-transferase n=1 Tax=Polyrhizophydium stewartii TaxID=2732419 RepID=A0ABR4NAM2_9FUNG